MEEGSRIFQVVERAGGFTERAAQQYLNMAQIVSDGMKIVVPDGESMEGAERYGIDSASGKRRGRRRYGTGHGRSRIWK